MGLILLNGSFNLIEHMDITLRQLEIFVATARAGSLAEAATRSALTRSAASMALASLERAAGGPLFVRAGHGLQLNDRGRRLLSGAEGLVKGAEEWLASARGEAGRLVGRLRIGCSLTIGNYCLPALLPAFTTQHPETTVELTIANSADIAGALRAGAIDLGLIESGAVPADLDAERWADDELVIVAAPSHPLARLPQPITPRQLAGTRWLLRERGSGTREQSEALLARIPRLAGTAEFGGIEAIKEGVVAGMGLALLSRHTVARDLATGRLAELALRRKLHRTFRLLTYPGQHLSTLARGFRDWLRETPPAAV